MNDGTSSLEPQYEEFTAWVKQQGVKVNGVMPAKLPERGIGIVAQRHIEVGEELVRVPASALLTVNAIPENFKALHQGISIHGLLASYLAFGSHGTKYTSWKATWPSLQDFQESMPILWPEIVREPLDGNGNITNAIRRIHEPGFVLPPAIGGKWRRMLEYFRLGRLEAGLLFRQEQKLKADWEVVSKAFPDQILPEYTYYWLVVNTRSFYFDALGGQVPENHDDRMVMCPFVDFFNHDDHGCDVAFNEEGYSVISDRSYAAGEELYTSYGTHGNDLLLVEYGFTLDNNKWDSLPLDDFFCGRKIHTHTKTQLKNAGYYGDYTLNSEGVCHRTQVAIRTQTLGTYQWKKFVQHGSTTEERDESKADAYLCIEILQLYDTEAGIALKLLNQIGDEKIPSHVKKALTTRWNQIKNLILSAFENGVNPWTQANMQGEFGEVDSDD